MMYQLLPFIAACSTVLPTLPIEVWCLILRRLDRKSLLSAVRGSELFNLIVEGDTVLRHNLKEAIKEENEEILANWTKPGMSAAVTRKERAQLFGTNVQKTVAVRKFPQAYQGASNKKGMKSIDKVVKLNGNTNRFKPYRI